MKDEELLTRMDQLCGYYEKKPLNAEKLKHWKKEVGWMRIDDFDYATNRWKTVGGQDTFPRPINILQLAAENRERRQKYEQEKKNRIDRERAADFFDPTSQKSEIGKDCVKAIATILSLNAKEKQEKEALIFGHLHEKYPQAGFNV